MAQLTLVNILLLIAGLFLQVLMTLNKVIRDKNFSLGYWIKSNVIEFMISIISAFVGVVFAKDAVELLGFKGEDNSPLYMVHAFLCGYMGREIIFRIIEWAKILLGKKK